MKGQDMRLFPSVVYDYVRAGVGARTREVECTAEEVREVIEYHQRNADAKKA